MDHKLLETMNEPILITGCARSGTSLVAGAINKCGAFGGNMSGPNHNNKKGMFENAHIRNDIVKPYLKKIGVDPMGQYPLPNVDSLMIPTDWKQRIQATITEEGYTNGPWMYKGAKMCLFWPVWHYAFPNAKWVLVRRKTPDIIRSCIRTGFMRAFQSVENQKAVGAKSEEEGWLWWVREHEKRMAEMVNEGLNCKIVWPERMVRRDYAQLHETIEWLGLEWTNDVIDFIDPLLFHSRQNKETK